MKREKAGNDVIKKRSKSKLKKELEKANQISIQIKVLEKLAEVKMMTSKQLRQYVESLGGDYELILPVLKASGLIKSERIDTGQRGRAFYYSLK